MYYVSDLGFALEIYRNSITLPFLYFLVELMESISFVFIAKKKLKKY